MTSLRPERLIRGAAVLAAALVASACGGSTTDGTGGSQGPSTTATTAATTTTGGGAGRGCSASGSSADLPAQDGLPSPVAETRRKLAAAAAACDFDALASLARDGGQPFTYSFGNGGDPAQFWREEERAGREPLRFLVEVLRRPYGVIRHEGVVRYAWPSAFTYDSWEQVPPADREALKPLYDEGDLDRFRRFGGYIGYRVVVLADGEWTAFVAGD